MKSKKMLTRLVLAGLLAAGAHNVALADTYTATDNAGNIINYNNCGESETITGDYTIIDPAYYFNAFYTYGVNNEGATVNLTGDYINIGVSRDLETQGGAYGSNYLFTAVSANAYNDVTKDGKTTIYGHGPVLTIGTDSTKEVNISVDLSKVPYKITDAEGNVTSSGYVEGYGLWAYNEYEGNNDKNGGQIIVNGEKLNITVNTKGEDARGILAQNCTVNSTLKAEPATVTINSKDTVIDVTANNNAAGLVAMSNGRIYANKGNIAVKATNLSDNTAGDVIVARGNAIVEINKNAKNTVKLDGNIDFNFDKPTSGTGVDADVNITLSDADSYFTGKIYKDGNPELPDDGREEVTGMTLNVLNGAQWNMTGDSFVNTLSLGKDAAINSKNEGQTLSADNFTMTGGSVNFDGSTFKITKAGNVTGGTITGTVSVDDTATLDLAGTNITDGALIDGKIKVEDGTASISDATGTAGNVKVNSGAELELSSSKGLKITNLTNAGTLTVDHATADSFTAEAGSRLVVDGSKISGSNDPAISGVKTVSIDDSAQLYIENAKKGEKYNITDKAIADASETYKAENVLTSNSMIKFTSDSQDGYDLVGTVKTVEEAYGDAVIIHAGMYEAMENDDTSAADFFNTAADANTHATKAKQAAAINSLAELGSLAGLTHGTYRAASLMTDAYTDHLSRDVHPEQGRDLWAVYTHSKDTVGGLNLAGNIAADYDLQLNGVVVGSDLYQSGTATAGIALSYADGSTSGWNGVARTKNDADYYGLSLYGRKDCGSMTYLGDITYLHGSNDLTQFNSGKRITADADTDAFSIGLTAQREYQAGKGRLTPYAGLRYIKLGTDSYTDSLGLKHDADDQDLFVLPVGIKYAADITDPCGWTWRPTVEAGYVWNLGDRDTSERVSYQGAGNTFGYNTLDSGSLVLRLGIQAEKDNMTYGLAYEHQNGDTTEANIFKADVKVRF